MLKLEDIYDVVIAKDGQEALDKVKESMSKGEFFDLIFMDVQVSNLHCIDRKQSLIDPRCQIWTVFKVPDSFGRWDTLLLLLH